MCRLWLCVIFHIEMPLSKVRTHIGACRVHACVQHLHAAVLCYVQVPDGDWFCSTECTTIKAQLGALVRAGEMTLGGTKEHSWHVLRGFKHSAGRVGGQPAHFQLCLDCCLLQSWRKALFWLVFDSSLAEMPSG